MNLYNIILREQNSEQFRKICTKYIIKGEKNSEIYIPYFIMEELDIKKEKGDSVEIKFEKGETVAGFYGLMYDIIGGNNNLEIKKSIDLEKYMTSMTLKKEYYTLVDIKPKYYKVVIETIIKNVKKEYLTEIFEKWMRKCVPIYISKALYKLNVKYNGELDEICSKYSLSVNINNKYNIEYLSSFKNIHIPYNLKSRYIHFLVTKIVKGDNEFEWLIITPCQYRQYNEDITKYERHTIYGKEIMFSKEGKIIQENIFKNIMKNQDNKILQLNSTLVCFIEENRVSKLYVPNNILVELDKNYYEAMKSNKYMVSDFEIILTQNESYEAYLLFLEDMLNKKTSIILHDTKDIQKLFIADRFNKNIYKHIYAAKNFNYDEFFGILLNSDTMIIDIIISKLFKHTKANTIYDLTLKYHSIPSKCLSSIQLTLKQNIPYNLDILSKFNCIRINQNEKTPIYITKNIDHYLVNINNINTLIKSDIFPYVKFSVNFKQIKLNLL